MFTRLALLIGLVLASACGSVRSNVDGGGGGGTDAGSNARVDGGVDASTATHTVTVTAGGNGAGTITSTPTGITCPGTCSGAFAQGTSVTLHAAGDSTSTFVGWSGGSCGGTGDCTFDVTADVAIQASFAMNNSIVVTLAGNGSGQVTSSPSGIDCPGSCSQAYGPNQTVTLTALATGDSYFDGWSGGGCTGTGPCTVTTNAAVGIIATFKLNQYPITVVKAGTGAGTVTSTPAGIDCGASCAGAFDSGTVITLHASPSTGSTFTGWSGGGCSGSGSCTVTATAATTVTATFTLDRYTLTVGKTGTGAGTVTSNVGGINCGNGCSATFGYGTVVSLSAAPATGSTFGGWSGGGCSSATPCLVTITADTTVTATFTVRKYTLSFTYESLGGGTGSVTSSPAGISCAGNCTVSAQFDYGTVVTLGKSPTGTPASLAYWSGDCTGTAGCSVTMTANRTVAATFSHTNYVFVSVGQHNGNWSGSLANADAFCQSEAAHAGLPGTYVAWISNSGTTAPAHVGSARGWMRVDGRPFADTLSSLVTNFKIFYPARLDADGTTLSPNAMVATGTNDDGTALSASQDCNNWSTSSSTVGVVGGVAAGGSGEWTASSGSSCDAALPWYCMGTDFTTPVTPAAAGGRKAFVLSKAWIPDQGIGNADSACQSEALAAGLVNSSRFRAFLATTSASAMSRFDLTGTAWVRTDGVQVAATPGDLATDNMLAPVTVQADGATYAGPYARVWGGATSATVAGTTAETCSNWSATSGATGTSGIVGYGNAGQFYWNSNWACTDRSLRVLCLEN